jgi:hypothetical protein
MAKVKKGEIEFKDGAVFRGGVKLSEAEMVELLKLKDSLLSDLGKIIQDLTVSMQASWIEWKHGKGAEGAMVWIHNSLAGPGFIPVKGKWITNAQHFYSANCHNPLPACFCGNPSHIGWDGLGACSQEHYQITRLSILDKK